jgi:hypothetical protein
MVGRLIESKNEIKNITGGSEMIRKEICCAVLSFFLISLGGFLLHLRIYPPMNLDPFEIDVNNLLPALPGIISVFVLTFMFNYRKTFLLAVMLTF